MLLRKLAASAAAIAMLAGPVAANAAPSAAVPQTARAGASLQDENNLEGLGIGGYILAAIAVGLAIWGIVELIDKDKPASP